MIQTHQTNVEMSRSVPLEVEVGADLVLKVRLTCSSGCDLRGGPVEVMAPDGVVMTSELANYTERINETEELLLKAPKQAGEHAWSILFPRHETEAVVHEESSLPIPFRTNPHRTSMAVWDIPSPVAMNSSFKVKVGIECSTSCQMTGQLIQVLDEGGTKVGEGRLGETPWQGTSSLYWGEVELLAPATEGVPSWLVQLMAAEMELAHEDASATFSFRTDKPPEHRVTVKVIGKDTQSPLENVQVRLGLYSVWTDEGGLANLDLPKGTYGLYIWKDGYEAPPRMTVEVREDVTVEVEALRTLTKVEFDEKMRRFEGREYW